MERVAPSPARGGVLKRTEIVGHANRPLSGTVRAGTEPPLRALLQLHGLVRGRLQRGPRGLPAEHGLLKLLNVEVFPFRRPGERKIFTWLGEASLLGKHRLVAPPARLCRDVRIAVEILISVTDAILQVVALGHVGAADELEKLPCLLWIFRVARDGK